MFRNKSAITTPRLAIQRRQSETFICIFHILHFNMITHIVEIYVQGIIWRLMLLKIFKIIIRNGVLQLKVNPYSQPHWNIRLYTSLLYKDSFLARFHQLVNNVEKLKNLLLITRVSQRRAIWLHPCNTSGVLFVCHTTWLIIIRNSPATDRSKMYN
jgi:hypothetical protein